MESGKSKHLPSQHQRRRKPHSQKNNNRTNPQTTIPRARHATRKQTAQPSGASSLAAIPMAGAVLVGTCLGGPVGLLAGLKIGAFAGIGGSLLGYSTANLVEEHM